MNSRSHIYKNMLKRGLALGVVLVFLIGTVLFIRPSALYVIVWISFLIGIFFYIVFFDIIKKAAAMMLSFLAGLAFFLHILKLLSPANFLLLVAIGITGIIFAYKS